MYIKYLNVCYIVLRVLRDFEMSLIAGSKGITSSGLFGMLSLVWVYSVCEKSVMWKIHKYYVGICRDDTVVGHLYERFPHCALCL